MSCRHSAHLTGITSPFLAGELWAAVKDTLRNSGKYGIIAIDNTEMTASYTIGGNLSGTRTNSVVLNSVGTAKCELQTQTAYSGLFDNDAADFKKRVDESLTKLEGAKPPQHAQPEAAAAPQPAATTPAPVSQLLAYR